jgi:demethylmenaquinone methyltransferase/2-methoxy-6-polyprenyl-1,4-benzoquinol methylase
MGVEGAVSPNEAKTMTHTKNVSPGAATQGALPETGTRPPAEADRADHRRAREGTPGILIPGSEPGVSRVLQSRSERRAFYNKISSVYDLLAERNEAPVRQAGVRMLNAHPGENILEIGFGTGHCLVTLARAVGPTGKAFGIDLSDEMLKITKERLQQEGLAARADLTYGDAIALPYPPDTMDAIFMSFTLELFDTPETPTVLAECRRVLRLGGRIVVVGMSKEDESGVVLGVFEWLHQHFPNYLDCRPIFVRKALEAAGFETMCIEKRRMWVPVEIVLAIKHKETSSDAATAFVGKVASAGREPGSPARGRGLALEPAGRSARAAQPVPTGEAIRRGHPCRGEGFRSGG